MEAGSAVGQAAMRVVRESQVAPDRKGTLQPPAAPLRPDHTPAAPRTVAGPACWAAADRPCCWASCQAPCQAACWALCWAAAMQLAHTSCAAQQIAAASVREGGRRAMLRSWMDRPVGQPSDALHAARIPGPAAGLAAASVPHIGRDAAGHTEEGHWEALGRGHTSRMDLGKASCRLRKDHGT